MTDHLTTTPSPDAVGRTRRRAMGAGLVGFAVLNLAQHLVGPDSDGPAGMLADAREHGGAVLAHSVLLLASSALLVPAVVAVLQLVRGRGAGLAHAAAALLVLGGLGHAAAATLGIITTQMPAAGDDAAMVALLTRLDEAPAVMAAVFPLIIGFGFGVLLLGAALLRSRAVPAWIGATLVVAQLAHLGLPGAVGGLAANGLLAAAFVALGVRVLGTVDRMRPGAATPVAAPA